MKLTTRLFIVIASVTLFAIVASFLLISANSQLNETRATSAVIDNTVEGMVEISILTSDYLLSPSDRASSQWQSKHSTITESLVSITTGDVEMQSLLQSSLQELQNTQITFNQLVENKQQSGGTVSDVSQQLDERLTGQISVDLQRLLITTSKLKEINLERLDSAHQQSNLVSFGLLVLLFITILAFYLTTNLSILRPIISLTQVAETISQGNLAVEFPETENQNEIGVLSRTFRNMTTRLQETLTGLEERVAARTKDLETVADISTVTATIRDPQEMLTNVVKLTQRGFELYHAHVFTYNKETDELEIVACGYKEGDENEGTHGHGTAAISIGQEQSLVALAARTRQPIIINDVSNEPGWLPNPQLPDTRAEMAVPMIVGEELLGVLDVQAEQLDAFTEEDANIQMTLASQISTALQNAFTYDETQKRAEVETLANVIGQRIQRTTSIEETLQTAIRELGTAIGASRVKASLKPAPADDAALEETILPEETLETEVEIENDKTLSGEENTLGVAK